MNNSKLKKYILHQNFVKISRRFDSGYIDHIRGFILDMSAQFLVVQKEDEFRLNGILIIHREDIISMVSDDYEALMKTILEKEGVFPQDYGLPIKKLSLDSWRKVFKVLEKHDYHVIIECEHDEDAEFYIGPISEIQEDSVGIRYYTPNAILDIDATFINFEDITTVTFHDRYTSVYRKYLRTGE